MAQYYNVVTNANGTFTIEDLQQLCTLDGSQVVVVEDNGTNVISQPLIAYTTTSDNTEQTIFSPQTINLGAQVATAQLDQRQNVFIIKTNDTAEPTLISKADSGNIKVGPKNQLNVCYAPAQTNWVQSSDNNETYEIVIKKDPSPVKTFALANTVKSPQHIIAQTSAPNVVVQTGEGADKKPTRLIPLAKRHTIGGQAVQIVKTPLKSTNTQPARGGKMRRNSAVAGGTNITLAAPPRAVTTIHQLVTPPRGPQARPPIHAELVQRNSTAAARNAVAPTQPTDMNALSERIRQQQANLKQKAQNEPRQIQKQQQPAALVAQRPIQAAQAPQRQRAMGQLLGLNRSQQQQQQQQQPPQQQQQQQQPQPQQQQQQQLHLQQQLQLQQQFQQQQQQLQQQHALRQAQALQARQQAAATADIGETPMEVDSSENVLQLERLNQINCTAKSDPEDSSSESYAYLQQEIEDPVNAIVQQQITGNEAKMLVILENGEQRLITFEVPKEDCTVQDLLEQANIQASQEPRVSLVSDPALGINYIVEIAPKSNQEEEQYVESNEASNVTSTVESRSPVKNNNTNPTNAPTTPNPRVPKYVKGMLAVCSICGMSAADFNYCMRCKRKLPEDVKAVPISTNTPAKKESAIPPNSFYKKGEAPKVDREAVARRGRGRGRGMTRVTKQNKEPECLTISSDEEDDNRKSKKVAEAKESTNLQNSISSEEADTILEKEPIITNNSVTVNQNSSSNPSGDTEKPSMPEPAINISTHLTCRTVRIGSYKYVPNNDIQICSAGLKLEVPCLEDDKSFITVDIKYTDLVKVLIHFSKSMPVLFFYTNVHTGLRIRDLLGMQDPKGPYFDPAGKDHTHKRITLLPEKISDESKSALKELYKAIFEELNSKEANDILVKASPKLKTQVQNQVKRQVSTSSTNNSNSNGVIQTITVYPAPPAKGGIAINTEDFICLAEDQFLNDVIIDFYLKYLTLEVLSEADSKRTHVFSSYFYKRLTSPHTQAVENVENLSAAGKRHARVQKWTKNVNIFEKDFIVIPINEHAHWFLAIICFPGLVGKVSPKVEIKSDNQKALDKKKKDSKVKSLTIGNTTITPVSTITIDTNDDGSERDEAEGDDEEMETDSDEDDEEAGSKADGEQTSAEATSSEPTSSEATSKTNCQTPQGQEITKVPCILIFDSLAGASRSRVVATLRDYLSCEHQAKMGAEQVFTRDTIKGASPKVPQQSNFTDCGLYVLQYVESFFQSPIIDYTLPIKTLKTWFEEITVTRKREELAKLLTTLVNKTKGNKTINLPTLTFPTQDGKLKQKPETQADGKGSKSDAEKKKASEPCESKQNASAATTNDVDSSNETATKTSATQQSIPQTSPQPTSTTDDNTAVNKETSSPKSAKSTSETMAFLKNKRIPRLQKPSDNQEDRQVAKKHKGESFDSCK